ncbi:hypothetical protein Tsubulata_026572 [Turnera subulata]|uniref:50S ribosomal protein L35 n=1 Tax=Turnera subulata TaxID=218843 RepID=A0A9Q0JG14_9ROSI|nr:hypothetical protein Tsubulata_026572 [Turnera subulata]
MASSLTMMSLSRPPCSFYLGATKIPSSGSAQFAPIKKANYSLRLSSSQNICGLDSLILPLKPSSSTTNISTITRRFQSLTVRAAKGYKMKTHKASAKRFRVTGKGKIMRRKAGKQHLLAKKNTKRKNRLSKMVQVHRSDYNNVTGALPYLKVNRKV